MSASIRTDLVDGVTQLGSAASILDAELSRRPPNPIDVSLAATAALVACNRLAEVLRRAARGELPPVRHVADVDEQRRREVRSVVREETAGRRWR